MQPIQKATQRLPRFRPRPCESPVCRKNNWQGLLKYWKNLYMKIFWHRIFSSTLPNYYLAGSMLIGTRRKHRNLTPLNLDTPFKGHWALNNLSAWCTQFPAPRTTQVSGRHKYPCHNRSIISKRLRCILLLKSHFTLQLRELSKQGTILDTLRQNSFLWLPGVGKKIKALNFTHNKKHEVCSHTIFNTCLVVSSQKLWAKVSWGYSSQLNGNIKFMFQSTNQILSNSVPTNPLMD